MHMIWFNDFTFTNPPYLPLFLDILVTHCVELTSDSLKHCVFGSVVEGMDVVRTIEGVGSSSGATKSPVMIASCGQLS